MKLSTVIGTSIASAMCSTLLLVWLVTPLRQAPIYRVDVSRIAMVQASLAQGSGRKRQRVVSLKRVREAIHTVAGKHLVLPSHAVIQGTTDITPVVLAELGLPLELPSLPPRVSASQWLLP